MADFKKNITNITKEDKDKYFQLPQDIKKYIDKKDIQKNSLEQEKKRLEEQLAQRKVYVELLEEYYFAMKQLKEAPESNILKLQVDITKLNVDIHNAEIEITAQKNVFVDSYIYYKEDFIDRYKKGNQKKKSVFKK
jgi:hypothetical protein